MAALTAPQAMIQNSLLAYVRTQEDAADRAGVRYLTATGQSAKGMYDTFKRLADQILYAIALDRSLHAVAPAAGGARAGAGRAGQVQPALGQEGFAGAAGASRSDARQALRLHRSARRRRAPLSDQRQQPAGALCARHRDLSLRQSAGRPAADRRLDPGAAAKSLFPRAQGPGAARRPAGPPRRSRRCGARCSLRPIRR